MLSLTESTLWRKIQRRLGVIHIDFRPRRRTARACRKWDVPLRDAGNQSRRGPAMAARHLVEHGKVNPTEIAVYCDLKFDSKLPPPPTFNLFASGDTD